jgi:hypothetical protein
MFNLLTVHPSLRTLFTKVAEEKIDLSNKFLGWQNAFFREKEITLGE